MVEAPSCNCVAKRNANQLPGVEGGVVHVVSFRGDICKTCKSDACTCQCCGRRICGTQVKWVLGWGNVGV